MFSMDKSFIRTTAKRTIYLQINLLGLQQMQLLKLNITFSQVPILAKIILQELLGSKTTLQTYLMIWRSCIFVTERTDFNSALDTQRGSERLTPAGQAKRSPRKKLDWPFKKGSTLSIK